MNPNKFYERTKLFNEILSEINQVESNYSSELNKLNLRLAQIIENHKIVLNPKLALENPKVTTKRSKTLKTEENKENKDNKKNSLQLDDNKKNGIYIYKEENSMVDKLISESLQNLLNFYKNKHKLISMEVSKLGVILYQFNSTQKKYDPEDLVKLENCEKEFDINYLKLMKVKQSYFKKMCEFEIYLHKKENDKKLDFINNEILNQNSNGIITEEERIKELVKYRQSYKKYLIRLSLIQREYIDKINEITNEIRSFNIDENNLLYNILKSFDENYIAILKEINNFCLLYEHNKKLINDLNFEIANNIVYDDRIYDNYVFKEYVPRYKNIKDQIDMTVIQKMNELIGFEFDKIKTNNSNNNGNKIDNSINYQNIDNNFLFILLMSKFTGGEIILTKKEKEMMLNLFNDKKYISEFLLKLNKIRINNFLFKDKENFDVLIEFFNYIISKISLLDDNNHELIKIIMILSETYYFKEGENKIFLISLINIPKEMKEKEFWIKYLEYEITLESKNYKNKKYSRYEYIILISHTTHLNEFSVPKETIVEIVEYFKNKYKFTNEENEMIKGQLNL